jgi:hypothetical protein
LPKNTPLDILSLYPGSQKNAHMSVQALVDNLGLAENVDFLGYLPESEMAGLYRRARALVMPTFLDPATISHLGKPSPWAVRWRYRTLTAGGSRWVKPPCTSILNPLRRWPRLWRGCGRMTPSAKNLPGGVSSGRRNGRSPTLTYACAGSSTPCWDPKERT